MSLYVAPCGSYFAMLLQTPASLGLEVLIVEVPAAEAFASFLGPCDDGLGPAWIVPALLVDVFGRQVHNRLPNFTALAATSELKRGFVSVATKLPFLMYSALFLQVALLPWGMCGQQIFVPATASVRVLKRVPSSWLKPRWERWVAKASRSSRCVGAAWLARGKGCCVRGVWVCAAIGA
jgi:hypothetical protein